MVAKHNTHRSQVINKLRLVSWVDVNHTAPLTVGNVYLNLRDLAIECSFVLGSFHRTFLMLAFIYSKFVFINSKLVSLHSDVCFPTFWCLFSYIELLPPHHAPIEFTFPGWAPASGYGARWGGPRTEVAGFEALCFSDARDIAFRCLCLVARPAKDLEVFEVVPAPKRHG